MRSCWRWWPPPRSWGCALGTPSVGRRSRPGTPTCPHDMHAAEIDKADWASYLAARRQQSSAMCAARSSTRCRRRRACPVNRYFAGSPIYPGHFKQDWNRSYILEPDGPPVGAVVLLHGLTDSPYSLRHVARALSRPRASSPSRSGCPRHGTVPAGPDRRRMGGLGRRHAARGARGAPAHRPVQAAASRRLLQRRRAGDEVCARRDWTIERLPRPDRLILISPMIGITQFARFAGLAGLPALLPGLRQGGVARHRAGVQPVQVQLVPGQRRAPVVPLLTRALQDRVARASRATGGSTGCRRS